MMGDFFSAVNHRWLVLVLLWSAIYGIAVCTLNWPARQPEFTLSLTKRSIRNVVPVLFSAGIAVLLAFFLYGSSKLVASSQPTEPKPADVIAWAQEVLRVGHNLVYYLWVVGGILVAIVAMFAAMFFTWVSEHQEILKSMSSWQDTVRRSESLILAAAQALPERVFVNFKDSGTRQEYEKRLDEIRSNLFSPEEIDSQIGILGVVMDVPADIYLRLGNYFRYRSYNTDPTYKNPEAQSDLWCALRRYQRAREYAERKSGRAAREMAAHALHGMAICLLRLRRYHEAFFLAKEAVEKLREDVSGNYQPVVSYGIAAIFLDKLPEAVDALKEAAGRTEFDVVVHYNLADAYAKWGKNTLDHPTQTMRYRLALETLRAIIGRVGTARDTINGIDAEADFDGIRNSNLAAEFAAVVAQLKAGS